MERLNNKEMKKLNQESTLKKVNIAIFVSDKVGYKSRNIIRNERGYFMMKKRIIPS